MMFREAQGTLAQFLSPLSIEDFAERVLLGGFVKIEGDPRAPRASLLGPSPENTLLGAWHLAPKLTFHSANPSGAAPSLEGVRDAADFQARIETFHARNYSVRFPELRPLSSALERVARALEVVLLKPVTASAFWSRGGMRAPVHYDDHDLLVAQLQGTKRWYVSSKPSELNNTWKIIPKGAPDLGPHQSVDVRPGDLMYLPRGTLHSVDSEGESLHLSIGFTPITVREALIAAVDHLSDLDPGLRTTLSGQLQFRVNGTGLERMAPPVLNAAAGVLQMCRTPGFLASALQWRAARAVAALEALPQPVRPEAVQLDSMLVHAEGAFCNLTASPETIDVSYPGGHLYIHRGTQQCVEYIVNTPRFRVRDIPGNVGDDIRVALAQQFLNSGFLERA